MLLRQPDATTCGSCCAVRARMLAEEGYDAWVRADATGGRFRDEALRAHRRTNRVVAAGRAGGTVQLPWPLALGTQPWALARELTAVAGVPHVVRPVLPGRRDAAYHRVLEAGRGGSPVAVYVGNHLLPRHVVLAHATAGDEIVVYDPASGLDHGLGRRAWVRGRLAVAGWDRPWFLVGARPPSAGGSSPQDR